MPSLTAFQIFPLLSTLFILGLGIFVLKNKKDFIGRLFFLISLVFAVWTFGTFMMFGSSAEANIVFWDRFIYLGVVFMPAFQYHFSLLITKYNKSRRVLLYVSYALSTAFLFLSRTKYFVDGVFYYRWGAHTQAMILHHFFLVFFFFYVFALLYNIYIQFRDSKIKVEKFKLGLIAAGFMILNLVGGIGYLPAYHVPIYSPISLLAPLFFSIIIVYTIFRYRFMDIRIVARKSFVYFGLTLYVFAFLSLFIWFFEGFLINVKSSISYLLAAAASIVFILSFYVLERFLTYLANRYFFAGLYSYQETIRQLSRELTYHNNLKEITSLIINTIKDVIQPDRAGVVLIDKSHRPVKFEMAEVVGFNDEDGVNLIKDDFLIRYLEKNREPIVSDELALLAREAKTDLEGESFHKLYLNMNRIRASLCLPLISERNLVGIIVLGAKQSGGSYTKEDLELLSVLANQAGIAVNNAQLYKQVNDFNRKLQERIDEQTYEIRVEAKELEIKNDKLNELLGVKNDFLRVVNHQLNTPLSIIKSSVYMIKSGSFTLEKGLNFIDEAVKNMEDIFTDFWKAFSFEGEGVKLDLQETDLSRLVNKLVNEAASLPAVKNKDLIVAAVKATNIPKVKTDAKQITQVINNLLQNAIAYTEEGTVSISLAVSKDGFVKVIVSDTGCGIDKADQPRIFEKFTRGQQAIRIRPAGSGLGLYIAKKIVEANGGVLRLERSEVGKGSAFYFTVPIWK
jgi:signal transduction histidine kinase